MVVVSMLPHAGIRRGYQDFCQQQAIVELIRTVSSVSTDIQFDFGIFFWNFPFTTAYNLKPLD